MSANTNTVFPEGFLSGAATAAYQIEGAVEEDGRTASIWDTFSHTPGKVLAGDTGDVATDHYRRWQEDVEAMSALGLGAYWFSISWPRVLPQADGRGDGTASPRVGCDDVEFVQQPGPYTEMGLPIDATGVEELLLRLHRDHPGLPLMITENGAAFDDRVTPEGRVHDGRRVAYLHDHLEALGRSIDAGVGVRGYFAWSLLDKFEWAYGYSKRFGIIHADYETQRRTWKDSAFWYRDIISAHAIVSEV